MRRPSARRHGQEDGWWPPLAGTRLCSSPVILAHTSLGREFTESCFGAVVSGPYAGRLVPSGVLRRKCAKYIMQISGHCFIGEVQLTVQLVDLLICSKMVHRRKRRISTYDGARAAYLTCA